MKIFKNFHNCYRSGHFYKAGIEDYRPQTVADIICVIVNTDRKITYLVYSQHHDDCNDQCCYDAMN